VCPVPLKFELQAIFTRNTMESREEMVRLGNGHAITAVVSPMSIILKF
jgi:hypothetical protein